MSHLKPKEHYVPKWYLKNFSSRPDRGFIWVYNTKIKSIEEGIINNLAQKPDIYGKSFEDFLNPIETRTRNIIQNIITSETIENIGSVETLSFR